MASILFVDYQTVIPASWLNDVNAMVYSGTVPANTLTVNNLVVNTSLSGSGVTSLFASPPSIGNGAPGTGAFTTLSASGSITVSGGTANGVAYLNGSKVLTTGSALTFDGNVLAMSQSGSNGLTMTSSASQSYINLRSVATAGYEPLIGFGDVSAGNIGQMIGVIGGGLRWTTGGSEQMRLTSTGLGIGTSSPGNKLDIQNSYATVWTPNSSVAQLNVQNNSFTSNSTALIQAAVIYGNGTFAGTKFGSVASGPYSADFVIANRNVGTFQENLRLTYNGNLGLGVTPSAWGTYKALQVNAAGLAGVSGNNMSLTSNAFYNGSNWAYISSTSATNYQQFNGQHIWQTAPSGTAGNAISFTQAMTLDANGRLQIGGTVAYDNAMLSITTPSQTFSLIADGGTTGNRSRGGFYHPSANVFAINADSAASLAFTTNTTERMRVDSSGNLLVGKTSVSTGGGVGIIPDVSGLGFGRININSQYGAAANTIIFEYNGSTVGYIQQSTTATAYVTSSDYRLKENIQPMQNALGVVAQLNPVTYTWKADGSDGQGFIAHELQAVVPDCVTGEKDAVDAEGNPVYQGVDTSFLVATLTKAIQEQQEQINQLKAEVAALKQGN